MAAVADEEYESAGTRSLIERGIRADAAIVTEPTRLAIMPAHLGFVWIDVTTHGRAAHGSRWDLGVDAIRHAGLVLAELDRLDAEELPKRRHALLGRPSMHASMISGGIGMSTYPDKCTIRIERRTIPGESPELVRNELEAACQRAGQRHPNFRAEVNVTSRRNRATSRVDAPIVNALRDALRESNEEVRVQGMTAWTDAALLNAAGIPAICFGPGDIGLAHAAEEYVIVEEIERATRVLERLAVRLVSQPGERMAQLTHAEYDALERAVTEGTRSPFGGAGAASTWSFPLHLRLENGREVVGRTPSDHRPRLKIYIDEIDGIEVLSERGPLRRRRPAPSAPGDLCRRVVPGKWTRGQ